MPRSGVFFALLLVTTLQAAAAQKASVERVVIENGEWKLIGDLTLPPAGGAHAAVLMLNKAAGNRSAYKELSARLVDRGIASLALDLRGHGESTNLGTFVPGEYADTKLIWESQADVIAALAWLRARKDIDGRRVAVVGASYSGEEMAEAARLSGFDRAYVALSPGSFSDESIDAIDTSESAWLLVVSRHERYLKEITEEVRRRSRTVELWELPGTEHATRLFAAHADLAERIAVWIAARLQSDELLSDPARNQ